MRCCDCCFGAVGTEVVFSICTVVSTINLVLAFFSADDGVDGGGIRAVVDFGTVLASVDSAMTDSGLQLSTLDVFLVPPVLEVVGASTVLPCEVVRTGNKDLAGDHFLFGTSLPGEVGALFLLSIEV